jgi:hypothetical protein
MVLDAKMTGGGILDTSKVSASGTPAFRCAAEFGRYQGIANSGKPTARLIYRLAAMGALVVRLNHASAVAHAAQGFIAGFNARAGRRA